MPRFIDTLLNRKFKLYEEINNLEALLYKEDMYGYSVSNLFGKYFLEWKLRNNYIDYDSFTEGMGIDDIVYYADREDEISIDDFLFYCEYIMNIVDFITIMHPVGAIRYIKENIDNIIEKMNYMMHYDENGYIHIVEKDILVSESAEIVQEQYELGECIYQYNYRDLKGDLDKKADILCRLYKYCETIENQAKNYGFTNLLEDITTLSNKLDVRHAPNERQRTVLDDMTADELELWFDDLFRLYLSLIILVDYTSKRKDIKSLKGLLG